MLDLIDAFAGTVDVDGVTGALVPFGRPTELGARVADLLADPGSRRRQGAAGRCRYMAGLGRDRMVAETAAVHERLPGASDRPVPAGSRT